MNHVVWVDNTPGNDEVFYKRSLDGGSNWSASKRLTWSEANSWYPDIGVDQSNAVDDYPAVDVDFSLTVHVVWIDDTPGNYEIYYQNGK